VSSLKSKEYERRGLFFAIGEENFWCFNPNKQKLSFMCACLVADTKWMVSRWLMLAESIID
jgi:hypothetical protein